MKNIKNGIVCTEIGIGTSVYLDMPIQGVDLIKVRKIVTIIGIMALILASVIGQKWAKSGSMYRPSQIYGYILATIALNEHHEIRMLPVVRTAFICLLIWLGMLAIWWEYTNVWVYL